MTAVLVVAGCSARTVTLTERSGVEQELLVRSLERAAARLDLERLAGRGVALELFALTKDERFAREFLTASLEQRGVLIVGDRAEADVALKVFATVVGVDVETQTFAYDTRTGRFLGRIPDTVGRAKFDQFTLLLVVSFTVSDLDERAPPE